MISAVVLSHDRLISLRNCIDSLKHSLINEIIIVDNGSKNPELIDWLKDLRGMWKGERYKILLLPDNRFGVVARNLAFQQVTQQFILQIDDDVTLHHNGVEIMLEHFKEDTIAVGPQGFYVCRDWSNFAGQYPSPGGFVDTLTGFCWMFRNNQLWQYPWEMAPFWFEEAHLCLEMKLKTGLRCRKTPMVCNHNCLRVSEVDWEQHNKNLAFVVDKFRPLVEAGELTLEERIV